MKKLILSTLLMTLAFIGIIYAGSDVEHGTLRPLKQRPELREQMNKMILSMFDIDIMMHKTREIDYEILQEDAERILQAIGEIRAKDRRNIFYKHLKNLEEPTQQLLKHSKKQSPLVSKYADQIFDACFRCHSVYRKNPLY